jgi:beta-lactamase class D
MRVGSAVDRFWKNGSLQISALEQAEFLGKVARGKLPVSLRVLNELRQLTLLEKTERYELHAKSGRLVTPKPELGWWIGWVERENGIFPFALNMDIDKGHLGDRVTIGRECLKALGQL